jgi:hypothetical protein
MRISCRPSSPRRTGMSLPQVASLPSSLQGGTLRWLSHRSRYDGCHGTKSSGSLTPLAMPLPWPMYRKRKPTVAVEGAVPKSRQAYPDPKPGQVPISMVPRFTQVPDPPLSHSLLGSGTICSVGPPLSKQIWNATLPGCLHGLGCARRSWPSEHGPMGHCWAGGAMRPLVATEVDAGLRRARSLERGVELQSASRAV